MIHVIGMRHPSMKYKVGQLRDRLNDFTKFDQKQFADLIGCTEHTVASLEATKWVRDAKGRKRDGGPRLNLSRELAWRIARSTGVALHWLLDDDLEAPIVNHANRPYTQKDFEQATKRSTQKEFNRRLTDDYASTFYA